MTLYQISEIVKNLLIKNKLNILLTKKISCYLVKIDEDNFFSNIKNNYKFSIRKLINIIEKLKKDVPIQYITNYEYFDGNKLYVDSRVLIPRPETEELCHIIKRTLNDKKHENLNIVNVGSGSGNIEISLSQYFKNSKIIGFEISRSAINVAKKNIKNHQLKNINLELSNIINNTKISKPIDILVSNPPYLKTRKEIDISVIKNEPIIALLDNPEESFYIKIISSYKKYLQAGTYIFFECEQSNIDDIKKACNLIEYKYDLLFSKDLNNKIRFAIIKIKE
jgi:release factor glutamine methyltransferase